MMVSSAAAPHNLAKLSSPDGRGAAKEKPRALLVRLKINIPPSFIPSLAPAVMTGKRKRGTAYNPTKTNKREKRASVVSSSPHPHGDYSADEYYQLRTVLDERVVRKKVEYLIDWEDNERTGEKYTPTWEPKENLTERALVDWEAEKLAKQAASLQNSSSTARKSQKTPVRNPVKRGRARRVLSSSSIGQSSSVVREQLPTASTDTPRPIEIRESPEASTGAPAGDHNQDSPSFVSQDSQIGTPAQQTCKNSPLFEPQDIVQEAPSQDLAFVQLSEPPSSFQNYTTLGSSQLDPATDSLKPSQFLPDSQHPVDTGLEITTQEPLVLATSQNAPTGAPTFEPNSTGRVVPDSQSLPNSFELASHPQAGAGDEAASQPIEDLQVAAQVPGAKSQSFDNAIEIQPPSIHLVHDRSTQQTGTPPKSPIRPSAQSPSPGTPASLGLVAEDNSKSRQRNTGPTSPDFVAPVHTSGIATYDFSSQLDCQESIEDRVPEPVFSSAHHHQTQVQLSQSPVTGTSFPFETQVAPIQSQIQAASGVSSTIAGKSHSQPISGLNQAGDIASIVPRANSLPNREFPLSSSFPAVPSQGLPVIGESAPALPYLPSTPARSPVRSSHSMDHRTPTSEPKMNMADKIRALKAEQALKRGRTPSKSATPSQVTPAKPSAVPPRINAELAAETPAQAGSPELARNGGRSPSAVPAALPQKHVTQDEMNTSGRYKTLVPQQRENSLLRRQSTITGAASKEASKGGNFVHSVPIALLGHQRDSYPLMIQHHMDIIEGFLGTGQPSEELIVEIETLLERLRRIVVHPDLDNVETYTQYDVPPAAHAKWAIDCSAKFHFLKHLVDELRDTELTIAVICQSAQLLHILENFLLGFKVTCYRADTGQTVKQDGCALTFKIMSHNEDASYESLAADAVICMDNSAEAGGSTLKLLHGPNNDLIMMTLAVPGTIEHVERCLSLDLSNQQKLRALVHGIFDLRHDSGKLEHGQLPSVETAKVIAGFLTSNSNEREWSVAALSMLENLDSQTESDIELPQSSAALPGGKHALDTSEVEIPASDTFKRPRLASNGVHLPDQPVTINPLELELDISHVSDSVAVASNQQVFSSEVINPSDLNETVRRLQSLLLTAQTSLADHKQDLGELQYRHEDQRNLIVELTRKNEEAMDTAQKAVTRMTENAATANTLRVENRSLKEQLKAAQEVLTDHSIPERAELEKQRLAFQQSQDENIILEKRLKTQQSDLDYAQEIYQETSLIAQQLGTTNRELENALSHAKNLASGEQNRAKQMTLDARASNLARENKQLKAKLKEQADALARKDKELTLMKEASRGRMGTRGSSVPRSPRMASPLKAAGGSRQSSPSATELRGRTHPLRQG
ncbi:hypothetical protein Q7P35_004367 [Cladosporium inversicolor]